MEQAAGGGGGAAAVTSMEKRPPEVGVLREDAESVRDGEVHRTAEAPKCPNLRGILKVAENRRVLISVIPTLTLAIMGG